MADKPTTSALDAAFASYTKLAPKDREQFKGMLAGYEYKAQAASSAGRKAAATKKASAAQAASA